MREDDPVEPASPAPPPTVEGYVLHRCLGKGAFGTVWLAYQKSTGKKVAVKFYEKKDTLDLDLLRREVENLAHLGTARDIVQLIDVGWDASPPFYVMEYLPQGSLEDLLASDDLMPIEQAVLLWKGIAEALAHVHGRGVLHCDLKPANVLLDHNLKPLLADFGQSRLHSEHNPALGTFFYMAPEQASTHGLPDARWDVYALGAILFRMLQGHPPHKNDTVWQDIVTARTPEERLSRYRQAIQAAPAPSRQLDTQGIDRGLAEILDRCLAADPEERFPNVQSVLFAIEARRLARTRRPLLILGAAGPALLLLLFALVGWRSFTATVHTSQRALTERLLQSSHFSAQFAARSAAGEIERRWQALERAAEEPELARLLLAAREDPGARQGLQRWLEEVRAGPHLRGAQSCFITDDRGVQLARAPRSDTIGKSFAFRDYFHGLGRDLPHDASGVRPIARSHLSIAFTSQAVGTRRVTFSTPVMGGGRVRGVIGMSVDVGHFAELPGDRSGSSQQIVVLADTRQDFEGKRGLILQHPLLGEMVRAGRPLPLYRLDPQRLERMRRLVDEAGAGAEAPVPGAARPATTTLHADEAYRDPVGGAYEGRWLATMEPVVARGRATGWVVIVQERYEAALRPISALRREVAIDALWALLGVALVLGVLWGAVIGVLSRPLGRRRRVRSTRVPDTAIASTVAGTPPPPGATESIDR